MFVWINFLRMIKFGIIGSDRHLHQLAHLVKNTAEFELTGWYDDNFEKGNTIDFPGLITYPSIDALFRYVDAVAISCKSDNPVYIVCKCLKHFKHVFLTDAQCLKYHDYNYILKIAEESNVKFYPEFGSFIPDKIENLIPNVKDVQFIDINHTFSLNEGICVDGRLSLALLRDINFITNFLKANVKKINANGWGFCEPGAGMLNAKIDFDNGASANLLLVNSIKPRQIQTVLYGKSEIVRINSIDNIFQISHESLTNWQVGCFEKIYAADSFLQYELNLFISYIQNKPQGLCLVDNKCKSIKTTHLIHEKIDHIASSTIFYS